ncbi:Response regulator [Sulfidibacter corallicola]|uniref:histidine kinase n=1 Tax=Sulfidibacter corallicola TaxID=2818388 RepID=A0A8A4TJY4_SULCO|nr:two-component regulator propeller domain-containing protein [Sulfidibacter corallicola]QTD49128.1 response regulator [Sulfidibacter corallicola]
MTLWLGTPVDLLAQHRHLRFSHLTTSDGLSQTNAKVIVQDNRGFIWIGTDDGLNRYDGYAFEVFRHRPDQPGSIPNNEITALCPEPSGTLLVGTPEGLARHHEDGRFETLNLGLVPNGRKDPFSVSALSIDRDGTIWVGTSHYGLVAIDRDGRPRLMLADRTITTLYEDHYYRLWVGTRSGLYRLDEIGGDFLQRDPCPAESTARPHPGRSSISAVLEDHRGDLWIGTRRGLLRLPSEGGPCTWLLHRPDLPNGLSSNEIRTLVEDRFGNLWIGGANGITLLDPDRRSFSHFRHAAADPDSPRTDKIRSAFIDRAGVIWIGQDGGGLLKISEASLRFENYRPQPNAPEKGLSHRIITAFHRDHRGELWVGTYGGGLNRCNPEDPHAPVRVLRAAPGSEPHLTHDDVLALAETPDGALWAGTYVGLNRIAPDRRQIRRFVADPGQPQALTDSFVIDLLADRQGRLWIATNGGGLNRWHPETDGFQALRHAADEPGSLSSDNLSCLAEDEAGRLWIGTWSHGLNWFDPETGFLQRFRARATERDAGLSDDAIFALHIADERTVWVGTRHGGLNRLNPRGGSVEIYSEAQGLPNASVYGIQPDHRGHLWLSTNQGITRFDPERRTFHDYTLTDGIQGNEFCRGASYRDPAGMLYFGGDQGFTRFFPANLQPFEVPPLAVAVTEITIDNLDARGRWRHPPESSTNLAELTYRDRSLTFAFAGLDFTEPSRNRFRYRLEGFDRDWQATDAGKRFATYTNLDPGPYRFRVEAAGYHGDWHEMGTPLRFRVLPPPWRTWWAYTLYGTFLCASIIAVWRNQQRKLAKERAMVQQLRELDSMKDEFLTVTSHELRTPLHGIIGLTESLLDGVAGDVNPALGQNLEMVVGSARRLTNLVNGILDFHQIRNHGLHLQIAAVDLKTLVDVVLTLSAPLANAKNLKLENGIAADTPAVAGDESRLQQVLYNLIGNAIKFTEEGGVRITARYDGESVYVEVIDTGIGIAADKVERIFEAFEQSDSSIARTYGGTGLGLAITQRLIQMHGGSISVQSRLDEGSVFQFTLPLADEPADPAPTQDIGAAEKAAPANPADPIVADREIVQGPAVEPTATAFRILVVDDEPVNRQVLLNQLRPRHARVDEASSGTEALAMLSSDPAYDLVLLDIMMPRMSGYEVCRHIRERFAFHELPVIYLTAKTSTQDLVAAFASGANDFLSKPVGKEELHARMKTHLDLLALNRELEQKVGERTAALEARNLELSTLNHIVQTINREMDLEDVVKALLKEAFTVIPNAARGAFLIRRKHHSGFRMLSAHRDVEPQWQTMSLSNEALAGLSGCGDTLPMGQSVVRICGQSHESDAVLPGFARFHARLVMTLVRGEEQLGLLLLDSTAPDAPFADADVAILQHYHEHAVSAVNKAATLDDLAKAQGALVGAAHTAGMAEVANSVLHNVGNILNSVVTSGQVLDGLLNRDRELGLLARLADLLASQVDDLSRFFAEDERAQMVVPTIARINASLQQRHEQAHHENATLMRHLAAIRSVIREQMKFSDVKGPQHPSDLNRLISDGLNMETYMLRDRGIEVTLDLQPLPLVVVERSKVIRIFFYLLKNSLDAMRDLASPELGVRSYATGDRAVLEMTDNGTGIAQDHLSQLFTQGFSTKPNHHGFGLHYCANAMNEMAGSVEIHSDGPGQGTRVRLIFPVERPETVN